MEEEASKASVAQTVYIQRRRKVPCLVGWLAGWLASGHSKRRGVCEEEEENVVTPKPGPRGVVGKGDRAARAARARRKVPILGWADWIRSGQDVSQVQEM